MGLKGIMSIAGKQGLYKLVSNMKNGFIVEGLTDKKKIPVTSTHKVSMLDDISIFTEEGDIPLKDVLLKIKEKHGDEVKVTSKSDGGELKSFLESVLPHYDKNRVYTSDIKKIVNWYSLVKNVIDEKDEEDEENKAKDTNPKNEEKEKTETTE